MFLRHVVDNPDEIRDSVLEHQSWFLRRNLPTDTVGEVHRVASVFALVASAGLLASRFEITGWSEADVVHSVEVMFRSWLASRGDCRAHSDVESSIRKTRTFLQANGASRFQNVATPEE